MCVPEAVPGVGLGVTVVELLLDGQCLLAAGEGLPVFAELAVVPADVVERTGLASPIAGGPVQVKRLPGVAQRFAVQTLPVIDLRDAMVGMGLPGLIGDLLVEVESLVKMDEGVVVAPGAQAGAGEKPVRVRLRRPVAQPPGGVQGRLVGGDDAVPVTYAVEIVGERPGQLPCVDVEAGRGRLTDDTDQREVLGGEPVERLPAVGEASGVTPSWGAARLIGSRFGSVSRLAAYAVCR